MTGRFRFILALAGCIAVLASAGPASAASWFELNFGLFGPRYDALVPLCDHPGVLGQISGKFGHKESEYWNSQLEIRSIERVREAAFRPWAAQSIPRRFCSGVARVSDGTRHAVHYSIAETSSWLGVFWGVEWCVVGLDRNWAYNPACLMAKP
jgi:hypothetical protein